MAGTFNVRNFGAEGNGVTDDRLAIQAAIDAAKAAGGGTVYIPTGDYMVSYAPGAAGAILLKNGVTIEGDGMGLTTIKLINNSGAEKVSGIIRTARGEVANNLAVKDLTLDGNKQNNTNEVIGFMCGIKAENQGKNENVLIDGVEIRNCSAYGFDPHEITPNMVIKNSTAHHNNLDGFVADYLTNSSVFENNVAWENARSGFNLTTTTNGFTMKNNFASDNGSAGLVVQRGNFNIPVPYNINIDGGAFYENAREGIVSRLANNINVKNVDVYDNARQGVRLSGTKDSSVQSSVIRNNSQEKSNGYSEVQVDAISDTLTSRTVTSTGNKVTGNLIINNNAVSPSKYSVSELSDGSTANTYSNYMLGSKTGTFLKGAASNSTNTAYNASSFTPSGIYKMGVSAADTITGSAGADVLIGGAGNDNINAGAGNDSIYGDAGNDFLCGEAGNDKIFGDAGNDSVKGGDGNDTIMGGAGNDTLSGGAGDDTIFGDDGSDVITGDAGNDRLFAGRLSAQIDGGSGSDSITGSELVDTLIGGEGDDIINGLGGNDSIYGGLGNDSIAGGAGNDFINGDQGDDFISGNEGNDLIYSFIGNDYINGGSGDDTIDSGAGADTIVGGAGNDLLFVGAMDAAIDYVVVTLNNGYDVAIGFNATQDKVVISKDIYTSFASVSANMYTYNGTDAVINLGANGNIRFVGVAVSSFDATDFVFV